MGTRNQTPIFWESLLIQSVTMYLPTPLLIHYLVVLKIESRALHILAKACRDSLVVSFLFYFGLFWFGLVFFPLPDCSKGLSGQFPGAEESPPRLAEISCASPWSLDPQRPHQHRAGARPVAVEPSAAGRPSWARSESSGSLGLWRLFFTFSPPGSPDSKVAADSDDTSRRPCSRE